MEISDTNEYLEAEAKRFISECLLINENITSVSDLKVTAEGDTVTIEFKINTPYGEVTMSV
jgi:uncharacterized alkaline shock family protein YloU